MADIKANVEAGLARIAARAGDAKQARDHEAKPYIAH